MSQNPQLGEAGVPPELSVLMNLRSLRLSECKLSSLPASLLTLTELQSIDLSKNNFTTFFETDGLTAVDVQW